MKYLFFLLLISSQLKSQNNFEVNGKIIENEPEKIVATRCRGFVIRDDYYFTRCFVNSMSRIFNP